MHLKNLDGVFLGSMSITKKTQKQHKILTTTTANVAPNGSRQGSRTNQPARQLLVVGRWRCDDDVRKEAARNDDDESVFYN